MEYDHTSLKRHLFINKFLYISFLIWGSWNSFPVVLSILVHFGSKRSWDGWFFMVVILLNRNWSLSSLKVHILKSAWVVHCIYNTKHLWPALTFNARYRVWFGLGTLTVYQHFPLPHFDHLSDMWPAYRQMRLQIIYIDIIFNWFLISFVHFRKTLNTDPVCYDGRT